MVLTGVLSVVCLSSCAQVAGALFRDMDHLPTGEFMASFDSPEHTRTVNIYLFGGGMISDFGLRGEVVNNSDGSTRNIYWSDHEQEADVTWLDEDTVVINGHTLNVLTDQYDFRKYPQTPWPT